MSDHRDINHDPAHQDHPANQTTLPGHHGDAATPGGGRPTGRRVASAVALVTGGVLAGGIMASALSATAAVTEPTNGTVAVSDCGPRGEALDADTQAKVEEAVLAAHADATVRHARTHPDGGYVAHVETADGEHLLVRLDESFAITEEVARSEMGRGGPRGFGHRGGGAGTTDGTGTTGSDPASATLTSAFAV